jgi:low affinity Fe/Cu permease
MNEVYLKIERSFEILTGFATRILGNCILFILAFGMVIYWWATNLFSSNDMHQNIGDIIFGTTFLSLFIIQKSFNRYSAMIHLKMNELISSHEAANNSVMNTSEKTEKEIIDMTNEYIENVETLNQVLEDELHKIKTENKI